jgi:hypothetical protein
MKIVKQTVNVQKRALSTSYTLEMSQTLAHVLDQEIKQELAQHIQDSFLEQELLSRGWHKITYKGECSVGELKQWCAENCQSEWEIFYDRGAFQSSIDAALFQLTWG